MSSAETKPKEPGFGKPCAGKPLARFDEGEGIVGGLPPSLLSLLYLRLGNRERGRDRSPQRSFRERTPTERRPYPKTEMHRLKHFIRYRLYPLYLRNP